MENSYSAVDLIRVKRYLSNIEPSELGAPFVSAREIEAIESGKVIPETKVVEFLLERLGFRKRDIVNCVHNRMDYASYMDEIDKHLGNLDYKLASRAIVRAETSPNLEKSLQLRQHLLSAKASVALHEGRNLQHVYLLLHNAMSTYINNFREEEIPTYLLSRQEIGIINKMALLYVEMEKATLAINLLFWLRENLLKRYNDNTDTEFLPMVYYNLSKYLGIHSRFTEAEAVCNLGRKVCLENQGMSMLVRLEYNRAMCTMETVSREEGDRLLLQTYHLAVATNHPLIDEIKKELRKRALVFRV
jgi:hypothetical protein